MSLRLNYDTFLCDVNIIVHSNVSDNRVGTKKIRRKEDDDDDFKQGSPCCFRHWGYL